MLDTATRLSMLQERYKSGTTKIFIESLNDAMEIISGKLATSEGHESTKRLIAIKKNIEQEIGTLYGKLVEPIKVDMQGFAEISHESIFDALNNETGLGYAFASLPKKTMQKIISMKEIRLVGDKAYTLTELFDNAKVAQVNRYKQIIAGGLASNDGYKNIVKRLKGANAKATTDMFAVVHTAISSARDMADIEAYNAFDDVITGWKSVSVLDSRTSLLCASLDGRKYFKSRGYKKATDIPNRPPRHFRCRSRLIPMTDFSTDSTRAENGDDQGQIPSKTKFEGWFGSQSDEFQENYLGKARYALYKEGRMKIKDFVDIKSGEKFTLDQIRAKFLNKPIKIKPKPKIDTPVIPTPRNKPKTPVISFGYNGKYDKHIKDVRLNTLLVIEKFRQPTTIVTGKGWYRRSERKLSTTANQGTFLHEYGHFLDDLLEGDNYNYYSKSRLADASHNDAVRLGLIEPNGRAKRAKRTAVLEELKEKWYAKKEVFHKRGPKKGMKRGYTYDVVGSHLRGFSDIIDSMTKGEFYSKHYAYGHGQSYYKRGLETQMTENFANLFRAYAHEHDWREAKELFPNLTKEFELLMEEIIDGKFSHRA